MIRGELDAEVSRSSGAKERRRASVLHVGIVKHRQSRVSKEVRPDVIVVRRVSNLVDRQVVWFGPVAPHEIVRGMDAHRIDRRQPRRLVCVDIDINGMPPAELPDDVGTARGDA